MPRTSGEDFEDWGGIIGAIGALPVCSCRSLEIGSNSESVERSNRSEWSEWSDSSEWSEFSKSLSMSSNSVSENKLTKLRHGRPLRLYLAPVFGGAVSLDCSCRVCSEGTLSEAEV